MVSVVIPCYNQGLHIKKAINSIKQQTYQNVEIIIVNDGSTEDLTLSVLSEYEKDSKIKIIHKKNGGLASARNSGIAEASGDYIQFLDADDWIHENKFKHQIEIFEKKHLLSIVYSNYFIYDDENGKLWRDLSVTHHINDEPLKEFLLNWESSLCIPIHCALFRRKVIAAIQFCEQVKSKEDWIFWIELALKGEVFFGDDEELAYYRQHSSNMCKNKKQMGVHFLRASQIIVTKIPESLVLEFTEKCFEHITKHYNSETNDVLPQHLQTQSNDSASLQGGVVFFKAASSFLKAKVNKFIFGISKKNDYDLRIKSFGLEIEHDYIMFLSRIFELEADIARLRKRTYFGVFLIKITNKIKIIFQKIA